MQTPFFQDRDDAGHALAGALAQYRGRHPLVLAIPRGAVAMASIVARELEAELDVVLVRKIGAPFSEEFAVGAVDESGWVYVAPHAQQAGATTGYIERAAQQELEVLRRRRAQYSPGRSRVPLKGRVVIIVDDGLATGATMLAALHAARSESPAELVCAVPVGAAQAVDTIKASADHVVCLHMPANFSSVGQWYRRFGQVPDQEVVALLAGAGAGAGAGADKRQRDPPPQ